MLLDRWPWYVAGPLLGALGDRSAEMTPNVVGLLFAVGFGFVLAWAELTDPGVIRHMLLLREPDVFLLMGSAIVVAGIGVRVLRARGALALVTGEPITWNVERPRARHVLGSLMFGAGWSLAGTCPAPVATMVGEGRLGGLFVVLGLVADVGMQRSFARRRSVTVARTVTHAAVGL
jgi:uncharacterized membrane protein YedE/YeeE